MDRLKTFRKVMLGLALTALCAFVLGGYTAKAAATVSVTEIDYEKSTITVELGSGDSELQISDSKQKTWESVTVEPVSGVVTLDISWIPTTKDYILSLRGDKNKEAVKVKIPRQEKTLKVTYTPSNDSEPISITGDNGRMVQWKKKNSTKWKTYNEAKFKKTLSSLVSKGGVIMFRTAPEKGDEDDPGKRPGKEVSVTIKGKGAAPKILIDDEKLTFTLEKGLEYRFCDEDGKVLDDEEWKPVPSYGDVPIEEIAPEVLSDGTSDGTTVCIQFRMPAQAKKQVSNTTTVIIPGQKYLRTAEFDSVKEIEYLDYESFKMEFTDASYSNPYEYCIINAKDLREGVTIESYQEIHWVTVSEKKPFVVYRDKNKATEGSLIYIRKKAQRKLGIKDYALASTYEEFARVEYPDT